MATTTIANIQTAGDYFRRSDEQGTPLITAAKKLEAAALAVEDIHNQALFRFTQRIERFDYLKEESDYVMSDNATNFEASVRIPDFRAIKDLRLSSNHADDFDFVDPNQFAVDLGSGSLVKEYTTEYRDGAPILRINQSSIGTKTDIHNANDHDANGTWAVDSTNSDATNIATDTVIYVNQGGSIRFDADVSQSANNRVTISVSDMTSVDLSAYQTTGIIRMWVYIPDVTDDTSLYVTSVELRWGSSASAYWSLTRARPVNSAIFQDRWNLMEFAWKDATETGSVTETAINYLLVTINYSASQADAVGFRINDIRIYNPTEMKVIYFSSFTAQTSGNVWIPRVTATTDLILAPDSYKDCYVFAYNYYILSMTKKANDPEIDYWLRRYKGQYDVRKAKWVGGELERLIREQGERLKLPTRKLRPQLSFN